MAKDQKSQKIDRESHLSPDVKDQRRLITAFLDTTVDGGKKVGDASCGIYAFFDFDGAAIYVGQTKERIRTRIRRHLTNRRTDAVAMKVLDPMEVAAIRVWPFWDLQTRPPELDNQAWASRRTQVLDAAEWTVYSQLSAQQGDLIDILNEKLPPKRDTISLPKHYEASIVEAGSKERLYHADERIARRASTIAALAQIVKERDVALGLRRTLMIQADRLHRLAKSRFDRLRADTPPAQAEIELTGGESEDADSSEDSAE
jgi:uncharacterized coiled-coil protein SlyX